MNRHYRPIPFLVLLSLALPALLFAQKEKLPPPSEAVGFDGQIQGTVAAIEPQGFWFDVKVSEASGEPASAGDALKGKTVSVGIKWRRVDGKWRAVDVYQQYAKSLQPGQKVTLQVKVTDKPTVRLLEIPESASVEQDEKLLAPEAAVGFRGNVTGTVKSVQKQGLWCDLVVEEVEGDPEAKGQALVGEVVSPGVRWKKQGGKWRALSSYVTLMKSLKEGQEVTLPVRVMKNRSLLMTDLPLDEMDTDRYENEVGKNVLKNPGFEDGDKGWRLSNWADLEDADFAIDSEVAHTGNNSMRMRLGQFYGKYKNIQLVQLVGEHFNWGDVVKVEFWAKGAENMPPIVVDLSKHGTPWTSYITKTLALNSQWQKYTIYGPVTPEVDTKNLRLLFSVGDPQTIWIDDVFVGTVPKQQAGEALAGNQVINGSFEVGRERWLPMVQPSGTAYHANRSMRGWEEIIGKEPPHVAADETAPDGDHVLVMEVLPNTDGILQSGYFDLRYGHPATLSFKVKTPGEKQQIEASVRTSGWAKQQTIYGETFTTKPDEWRTYSLTFTPEPTSDGTYYIRLDMDKPGLFLFDDFIVNEGETAENRVPVRANVGWTGWDDEPPGRLYHRGNKPGFEMLVEGLPGQRELSLETEVIDVHGNVLESGTLDLALDGDAKGQTGVNLPANQLGAFKFVAWEKGAKGEGIPLMEWQYQVLPKLPPLTDVEDFYFGGHAAVTPEALDVCEKVGIRSIRLHPPINTKWRAVETEPGVWDFETASKAITRMHERGFNMLGNLALTPDFHADKTVEHIKPDWRGYGEFPPKDWADYREYVRRSMEYYKGVISEWEIDNEPNDVKVPTYRERMRQVRQVVDENDFDVTLVGGVFHAIEANWADEIIGTDLHDYVDVWSFHMYGGTVNEERERLIREWQDIPGRDGPETRLWQTEGAFLPSMQTWYRTLRIPGATPETAATMTAKTVQRLVELKSLGVERNYQFPSPMDLTTGAPINKYRFTAGFDPNGLPLPLWAGHAACVLMLEGAVPVSDGPQRVAVADTTITYATFQKEGKLITVLWADTPIEADKLTFISLKDASLYSMMGNAIDPLALKELGLSPVYVLEQ